MPSPKSGTAGTLVAPTAPTDAKDADDATGGSTQDVSNSGSKSGSAGTSVTVGAMSSASSSSGDGSSSDGSDNAASPEHKPADNPDKTSWIELQLIYESNGLPVAGEYYEVTLPDGTTVASGSTDEQGVGRVECIDPGSCQISFPDLDKDAWSDA